MHARRLRGIAQVPERDRFKVLAEGLNLLAENVATLESDATSLGAVRKDRGAAVLRSFADEEAAKVLIVLDIARAGWGDQSSIKRLISNFYSHLARGLYVRAYGGSPADLREVREYVEHLRQEFFLDGPMEVDWIFGNEVTTSREERLYVDYIEDEAGQGRWTGPADAYAIHDEPFRFPAMPSTAVSLVGAMNRVGLLGEQGLAAVRDTWNDVRADETMHWSNLQPLNLAVLQKLLDAGVNNYTDDDVEDLRYILDRWIFPLSGLDLAMSRVKPADLIAQREHWISREMDDTDV